MSYLGIVLQVDNLIQRLVIEVIVVAVPRNIVEAQRLEDNTEEPGQEDVARHKPS